MPTPRKHPKDPLFPSTLEGWDEEEEKIIALWRAKPGDAKHKEPVWAELEYDHWRLWVVYQFRKKKLGAAAFFVAQYLPLHVDRSGKPNVAVIARTLNQTPAAVRRHLQRLVDLDADFSRLGDWPHPLHSGQLGSENLPGNRSI